MKKNTGSIYTPELKAIQRRIEERRRPLGSALSAVMQGRSAKLCKLLVSYFNGAVEREGAEYFTALLMDEIGQPYFRWDDPSDAEAKRIQRDVEELRAHHRMFKEAVIWLCRPKVTERGLPEGQISKLLLSGKLEWGRYPDIDSHNESFVAYFEKHGSRHFRPRVLLQQGQLLLTPRLTHLIDIFCAFLLHESAGREPEELPVKICVNCGRLFSVLELKGRTRARKEYCSSRCQQRGWWPKEKRADDIYVKRLLELAEKAAKGESGYTTSDLRKRLESPRDRQRLQEIKKRWAKDWPKIVKRVAEIEQLARGEVKHGKS